MSKNTDTARRSWVAQSAHRTGAGPHKDGRTVRQGTRAQQREHALDDALGELELELELREGIEHPERARWGCD